MSDKINKWIAVSESLPKAFETVWLSNGIDWVCLGCLVEVDNGWHWAESNGIIYAENGCIVSECDSDDLDVVYWHELPKLPIFEDKKLAQLITTVLDGYEKLRELGKRYSIPIKKEPKELYEEFKNYEKCNFCRKDFRVNTPTD